MCLPGERAGKGEPRGYIGSVPPGRNGTFVPSINRIPPAGGKYNLSKVTGFPPMHAGAAMAGGHAVINPLSKFAEFGQGWGEDVIASGHAVTREAI